MMTSAVYELVVLFLAAGLVVGWFASRAYAAHKDVRTTRRRIPASRRARQKSGLAAFFLAVGIVIIIVHLMHHVRLK
jgi:hypothetical protein